MDTVPDGYKLAVISPEGNVLDTIDLAGYDLTKTLARIELMTQVSDAVEMEVNKRWSSQL